MAETWCAWFLNTNNNSERYDETEPVYQAIGRERCERCRVCTIPQRADVAGVGDLTESRADQSAGRKENLGAARRTGQTVRRPELAGLHEPRRRLRHSRRR